MTKRAARRARQPVARHGAQAGARRSPTLQGSDDRQSIKLVRLWGDALINLRRARALQVQFAQLRRAAELAGLDTSEQLRTPAPSEPVARRRRWEEQRRQLGAQVAAELADLDVAGAHEAEFPPPAAPQLSERATAYAKRRDQRLADQFVVVDTYRRPGPEVEAARLLGLLGPAGFARGVLTPEERIWLRAMEPDPGSGEYAIAAEAKRYADQVEANRLARPTPRGGLYVPKAFSVIRDLRARWKDRERDAAIVAIRTALSRVRRRAP